MGEVGEKRVEGGRRGKKGEEPGIRGYAGMEDMLKNLLWRSV